MLSSPEAGDAVLSLASLVRGGLCRHLWSANRPSRRVHQPSGHTAHQETYLDECNPAVLDLFIDMLIADVRIVVGLDHA